MKIIRGNTEIELTDDELTRAYLEQQHRFDIEDIKTALEAVLDDCEAGGEYAAFDYVPDTVDARYALLLLSDPARLDRLATSLRRDLSGRSMVMDVGHEKVEDAIAELRQTESKTKNR